MTVIDVGELHGQLVSPLQAREMPEQNRVKADEAWDGLKGYLTNTAIPAGRVYKAYHNLWNVERAFRIAKSKIKIRPMFHFTRRRIEAHVCICFVALKVYKELERILKKRTFP